MPWLLELNDAQVSLYEGLRAHYQQPAVTLWLDGDWHHGAAAWEQSKLHPQQSNNLYLSRLSTEPLARAIGNARNYADLAFQQLRTLQAQATPDALTVAVPSNLANEQLGVLLGIAKEAELPVAQFCDAALLGLVQAPIQASEIWVVDVALHQLVLTGFSYADGRLTRTAVELVNGAGLANLMDGWANVAADQFVKATRFDPLHAASSEQQLHNQVLSWLYEQERPAELTINIDLEGNNRRVNVNHRVLAEKTKQRAAALSKRLPENAQVAVTARCAALPGLLELLPPREVIILPELAIPEGYLALQAAGELIPGDGVVYVTSATYLGQGGTSLPSAATELAPTHGLHRYSATPLVKLLHQIAYNQRGDWLHLPRAAEALVNGATPDPDQALACGDELSVGARQYQLVHVLTDNLNDVADGPAPAQRT